MDRFNPHIPPKSQKIKGAPNVSVAPFFMGFVSGDGYGTLKPKVWHWSQKFTVSPCWTWQFTQSS